MKVFNKNDREKYLEIQTEASDSKFKYCKFSYKDSEKYLKIINSHKRFTNTKKSNLGPILSLGVRNGREVDLFRVFSFQSLLLKKIVAILERKKWGLTSWIPFFESINRSDFNRIDNYSSIGVELNPLATRKDIWIGSFDEVPEAWYGKFNIVYTNAFDHAFDPLLTIEIWKKLLSRGGYMIFCFPQGQPSSELDNVEDISFEDVLKFFPGELIYYNSRGSSWHYTEYIIKMP